MDDRDIVDELVDWAEIIDGAQGRAVVVLLSGDVHREAAAEIKRLRAVIESYEETEVDNAEHRRTKNGDEVDAYSRWRKMMRWRAGERKAIKRRTHKRERQEAKNELLDD